MVTRETNLNLLESRRRILLSTPHIESKSSLSPLRFSTDVVTGLKECKVHFSPVQEGSGTPSPENVRPITGWDGVSVTACGKNLLETQFDTFINGGITFSMNPDKSIHLQGTINSTGNYCTFIPYIYIKPGNYKYSKTNKNAFVQLTVFDQNGQIIQRLQLSNDILSKDITISKDSSYMDAFIRARGNIGDSVNFDCGVQIEYASIATPYEPYQGESYDIDFPDTFYSGTVDLLAGTVTVDMATVDLGTLTWDRNAATGGKYRMQTADIKSVINPPDANNKLANVICSNYKTVIANDVYGRTTGIGVYSLGGVAVYDENYSDGTSETIAAFKSAMSGVQLVYELATPQTYQLTPETIRTLKGINNVFSNANGNIDVKFYSH